MTEEIRLERRGAGVVWVILDRPEVKNALSGPVLEGLLHAATLLGADSEVRAVVVTGAGTAFSAGADLKERRGMSEEQASARLDLIGRAFSAWARMPKPTIAAINGAAFGGGLEFALTCDLRVAVESAELALTEVRMGIIPGAGGTQRLPRLIGVARAKELILLGRRIRARRAAEIGLVNEVTPDGELIPAIDRLLAELAGTAPVSVAQAKAAIDQGIDVALDDGLVIERSCYGATLGTEDRNEGLCAFAEKRPPRYQGR